MDGDGNVYIADSGNGRIRKVDATTRTITTIAGSGECCFTLRDGGPARQAWLYRPVGVAVDGDGNVYIAVWGNHLIRKLTPVGPAATQYYFPHLAVGASWQTTITYINYSPEEVTCQTDFLSDHGSPLMVSFAELGMVDSRTDVLPPGGSVHQETNVDLSAPLAPGWARATCSRPVKASLLFRRRNSAGLPTAEAGVNAASVPATRFVTFAEQGEGQSGTGVAYANRSGASPLVTFTVRDTAGQMLASVVRILSPRGHDAHGMAELFGLTSFTGSLEVTSNVLIVSLSLNFEADPVFSSLPPGELDAHAQGSTTYYFPHLAVGASWQTTITYINYSPEEVTCQTDFLSDHGSPLMVSFAGLGTVDSRTDVLPPRRVRSRGDRRGAERCACVRLGAGYVFGAGEDQPPVSSVRQRRRAHGRSGGQCGDRSGHPLRHLRPNRRQARLGPALPMPTLPLRRRPGSPLRPRTRRGGRWTASIRP